MKTPERISREEFFLQMGQFAAERISPDFTCKVCGQPLESVIAYVSIHVAEFENCSGPGRVGLLQIPYCPHCDPRPSAHGCLHVPVTEVFTIWPQVKLR